MTGIETVSIRIDSYTRIVTRTFGIHGYCYSIFIKSTRLILNLVIVILCLVPSTQAQERLTFSKSGPLDHTANISELILYEAYQRAGIETSTVIFPAERALVTSNAGGSDGEVNRIRGLNKKYTNLIRVPVPIAWIEAVVITKRKDINIESWNDLKPYSIGIRIGTKFAENRTRGMNVTAVPSNESVFKMLNFNRIELAVSSRMASKINIKKYNLKDLIILEPPLMTLELFHYLHKKHAALVPQITKELQAMADEGRILEIRNAELSKLF